MYALYSVKNKQTVFHSFIIKFMVSEEDQEKWTF